jgi:CDP-glycerol glycerophosphotransferase (TagB/SpsB family)
MKPKHKIILAVAVILLLFGALTVNRPHPEHTAWQQITSAAEWLGDILSGWTGIVSGGVLLLYIIKRYARRVFEAKLVIPLIELLQPLFPKDTYILFDNLYEKNAECIDTWALFQYLREKKLRAYYVLWRENPFYQQLKKERRLDHVLITRWNLKHNSGFLTKTFPHILRTKYVITSFGDLFGRTNKFLFDNKYIIYINTSHGSIFLKTFVLECGYVSSEKYNKFLIANDVEKEIFTRYEWHEKDLVKTGLPRWDLLKHMPHEQKTIFVMFTWRTSFMPSRRREYPYKIKDSVYFNKISEFLQHPALHELLAAHHVHLKVALHHALLDQGNSQMSKFADVEMVEPTGISKQIGVTDLFITDYSSIFFDFAYLNIPIIFYRPDFDDTTLIKWDRDDMEHSKTKDELLYNVCYDPQKAVTLIKHYIEMNFVLEKENREKNARLFDFPKNIRENLTNLLEHGKI